MKMQHLPYFRNCLAMARHTWSLAQYLRESAVAKHRSIFHQFDENIILFLIGEFRLHVTSRAWHDSISLAQLFSCKTKT